MKIHAYAARGAHEPLVSYEYEANEVGPLPARVPTYLRYASRRLLPMSGVLSRFGSSHCCPPDCLTQAFFNF